MAKGPFAGTGDQASEIAPAQLGQGGAPSQGAAIASGVEKLANIIVPAVRENRTKELQDEVTEEAADVKKFLKLARNPELLTSEFGVDAIENPSVRQALDDFVRIRDSREQGILPGRFALERLEVIMNDAIADAPAFAKEIRMAMVAATGQDPSKTLWNKILAEPKAGEKSDFEKGQSKVFQKMAELNMSFEEVQAGGRYRFKNQMRKDQYEIDKRNDVVQIEDIASQAVFAAGESYGDLLEALQREKTATGGISPDFSANFLTQMKLEQIKVRTRLTKGLNGRLDAQAIENAMAPLVQWEKDLTFIVENNLMETLIANRVALKQQIITGTLMNNADDATALTIGGKEGFLAFKKFLNEKDNPTMARLQQQLFSDAANAASLRGAMGDSAQGGNIVGANRQFGMPSNDMLVNQYANINDGNFAQLNGQQKTARRMAANFIMRTPKASPAAVQGAVATLQGDYGWRAIQNRDVVATAMEHPIVAQRVVALQTNQTGALAMAYTTEIENLQGFNANNLRIVDGQLVYKDGDFIQGRDASEADQEVPAFVARFNRAVDTSSMYARVGILNETKFTTPEAYLRTIQTAVKKQQSEETPKPKDTGIPEFVRDDDGNIVLKRG